MKSFGSKPWILPQPVLIIGTYDKDGKPNAMNAAWGGQWDMHEIIISLGSHQTTDNLAINPEFTVTFATVETLVAADYVGIVSGRNTPDVQSMHLITYDPVHHTYIRLGETVGNAFSDGKQLK